MGRVVSHPSDAIRSKAAWGHLVANPAPAVGWAPCTGDSTCAARSHPHPCLAGLVPNCALQAGQFHNPWERPAEFGVLQMNPQGGLDKVGALPPPRGVSWGTAETQGGGYADPSDPQAVAAALTRTLLETLAPALRDSNKDVVREMKKQRETTEAQNPPTAGKISALRRDQDIYVYLMRDCDRDPVLICPHLLGKDLYHGLKRIGGQALSVLQSLDFPCFVSNRMAYGLASLCLGTREANTAPDHYLLLRDFVTATGDPLEEGPLSTTDKLDSKRPPPPAKPADFMECVTNLSNIMTKVYGERWSFSCSSGIT